MLGFHKFNEYLTHFSKTFAKPNQRTKDLVTYGLKQNPENVHFMFTDSEG